jgi:hypothetical protein
MNEQRFHSLVISLAAERNGTTKNLAGTAFGNYMRGGA